jgi:hypothetical protein
MAISDDGNELTSFEDVCSILSELWINHKGKKEFQDFISYNDLGLPLAFAVDSELVTITDIAKQYIEETWSILLKSLEINEDVGFSDLEELFNYLKNNKGDKNNDIM